MGQTQCRPTGGFVQRQQKRRSLDRAQPSRTGGLHRSMRVGSAGGGCIRRTDSQRYSWGRPASRAFNRSGARGSRSRADRRAYRQADSVDPPTLPQARLHSPRALPIVRFSGAVMRGLIKISSGQKAGQGDPLTFWCETPRRAPARSSRAVSTRGQRSGISLDVALKRWGPDLRLIDIRAMRTLCGGPVVASSSGHLPLADKRRRVRPKALERRS
jgi:hypothetical protein